MNQLRRLVLFLALVLATICPGVFGEQIPLRVHFLDVGQADCILIQTPNERNMLIDAGNNGDQEIILSYLERAEIKQLAVVVGTHPHEDHIGSMDTVINRFPVERVYLPKVTTTTETFASLLSALKQKGLSVKTAKAGVNIELDPALSIEFIAPNGGAYEELNDYSAVIKLTYKQVSFLFTGDAGVCSEREMMAKGTDLRVDLLKVGHHGSNTSTSRLFLEKVNPKHAVISVGAGNRYGHPDQEVINRLYRQQVEVHSTDEEGTIIAVSDGERIKIIPGSSRLCSVSPEETVVYITKSGRKYHQLGCRFLQKGSIPISLTKAQKSGYSPCGVCRPPQ